VNEVTVEFCWKLVQVKEKFQGFLEQKNIFTPHLKFNLIEQRLNSYLIVNHSAV
jgi:hypothetical protein